MADVCVAEIDTLIDVSPADITTAADWLDKLQQDSIMRSPGYLPQHISAHRFQESLGIHSTNILTISEEDVRTLSIN